MGIFSKKEKNHKKYKWVKATLGLLDSASIHACYLSESPYKLNGNKVMLHREGDWFILKICYPDFPNRLSFDLQFTKEQLLKEDFEIRIEEE